MTRVLFVDDEPAVLDALRRQLRSLRREWEMTFATEASEALELMDAEPVDVLVTDIRMPVMDGVELLQVVRSQHPGTARFVLSGHTGHEAGLRLTGLAHQFLSKPCDIDELLGGVRRALALRECVGSADVITAVSKINRLPSVPSLYSEIVSLVVSDDASLSEIAPTPTWITCPRAEEHRSS